MDQYSHTQSGKLHYILLAVAVGQFLLVLAFLDQPVVAATILAFGILVIFLSFMFKTLTVSDEGDWLRIQYGPLRVIHKRFRYAEITEAVPDKSKVIDGWGIHSFPGRGTTYNLWGYDCVRLNVAGRTIRIGTDDSQGLAEFLQKKIQRG